jgi:butyrate kinase
MNTYLEECFDLGLDLSDVDELNEAGGLLSWLARVYTGKDKDLPGELEEELSKIKTQAEKENLIKEINDFIYDAEQNISNDTRVVLRGSLLGLMLTNKNRQNGVLDKYLSKLKEIRVKIRAKKVS